MANKKTNHGESKTQVKNNVQKPKKNGRGHQRGEIISKDVLFNKRPEQLSVQQFIDLTNSVEEALKSHKAKIDVDNME